MPVILFTPSQKTIDVSSGSELLDAARPAEIEIDSPCGGKGRCCKCLVRIVAGQVELDSLGLLPKSAIDNGYLLACRTIMQLIIEKCGFLPCRCENGAASATCWKRRSEKLIFKKCLG